MPHQTPDSRTGLEKPNEFQALSDLEVAAIATELQAMVGSQLQECVQTEFEFALGFYHQREIHWLWFDFNPLTPMILTFIGRLPPHKKINRPLSLFLRSRFLGRRLQMVSWDKERGRVLLFSFHRASEELKEDPKVGACEIEVRLYPHGANAIARDGRSVVAEKKPKELTPQNRNQHQDQQIRTWDELQRQWQEQWSERDSKANQSAQPSSTSDQDLLARWQKNLDKKRLALDKMRADLAEKSSPLFAEAGEWLKANGTLEVPQKYHGLIDGKRSLSWNIEECFRRAKSNQKKLEGSRARIAKVEIELQALEASGPKAMNRIDVAKEKEQAKSLFHNSQARGRRLMIAGDLELSVGKSGADNLALLKKAQPFDYWLHLREEPGSHGFIRRAKNRVVTDLEFIEAGIWVIEQSTGKRRAELKGLAFDLLIVECRFVRAVRGDSSGRVTYSHDRVMRIRL